MDVVTVFFGTALTVLPLVATGLLATLVLLERSAERERSATAAGQPARAQGRLPQRRSKTGRARHG